jgi:alpha-L-fucosidase
MTYGEGPTKMAKTGYFSERNEVEYTANDIRFTVKDNILYATCLGWPGERVTIESLKGLYESEISSIKMLGIDQELKWSLTAQGLEIERPTEKPGDHAYVFKITRKQPF